MRMTLTLIAFAVSLGLNFGAYAADTNVPGATNSTPGAESKGNPITPPDDGSAAASQTAGTPAGGTMSTPGAESKGNPIPPPQ